MIFSDFERLHDEVIITPIHYFLIYVTDSNVLKS